MNRITLVAAAGAALALAPSAQTLTEVIPSATGPGTTLVLRGQNLQNVTTVRFRAQVGGFVGVWTEDVPAISATFNEVRTFVPDIPAGWVPPGAIGESSPLGDVTVLAPFSMGPFPTLPFYFFEGTHGFLESAGIGGTQTNGERAVGSFEIPGGAPAPGNPNFVATVELFSPGQLALLGIAPALTPPYPPFGDGELVADAANLIFLLPGVQLGFNGAARRPLPIPPEVAGVGAIAFQWVTFDPITGIATLSDAMVANY